MRISDNDLFNTAQKLRRHVLLMVYHAQSGHPGGPLSAADYLCVLWKNYLQIKPADICWDQRDRFILSNGHCSALLYALMADAGYFPESELTGFRSITSHLLGHPSRNKLPGIEVSTGSLGQGLSVAHGIALGLKLKKNPARVFCNLGDGELQEGNVWEAVLSAAHYKSDNLYALIDYNNAQIDGTVSDVKEIAPLKEKFEAFNWHVIECRGHNYTEIRTAYEKAFTLSEKPKVLIFTTCMMHGCPSFENDHSWHGKVMSREELSIMLSELGFDPDNLNIGEESDNA